jgi:hypothetical protein
MAVGWLLLFGLAVGLFAAVHIRVRRISGRENIGWRNILSDIDGLATRLLRRNGPGSLLGVSGTPERKGQRRSRRTPPRRRSTATDAAHARDSNPLQYASFVTRESCHNSPRCHGDSCVNWVSVHGYLLCGREPDQNSLLFDVARPKLWICRSCAPARHPPMRQPINHAHEKSTNRAWPITLG